MEQSGKVTVTRQYRLQLNFHISHSQTIDPGVALSFQACKNHTTFERIEKKPVPLTILMFSIMGPDRISFGSRGRQRENHIVIEQRCRVFLFLPEDSTGRPAAG